MQKTVKLFLISFFLTSIVFFVGVILGKVLAQSLFLNIELDMFKLMNNVYTLDTALLISQNLSCNEKEVLLSQLPIGEIGRYLTAIEKEYGYNDKRVLLLKEFYIINLIKMYEILKKYNKECKFNWTLILYFYSNDPKYREKCIEEGRYLDYIVYKYYPKVRVFAIEGELIKNPIIEFLKKKFNVTTYPTIVINEKIILKGVVKPEELERYIK